MKRFTLYIALICLLAACKQKNVPDVSGIRVNLSLERFEQDFFAVDTNDLAQSLKKLSEKYPQFLTDFTVNILGLPPISDTSSGTFLAIKQFIRDYRPVKDSADIVFKNIKPIQEQIQQSLQFTKHYFPDYQTPSRFITFIGPMDAYDEYSLGYQGDVLTYTREGKPDALAAGLQLHLGNQFSIYHSEMGQALYPEYISRRFGPEYVAVNCMRAVIDGIYPERTVSRPLLESMIEKGKRLYVLDKIMPFTPDTLKIGYTARHLKGCYENEGRIWNFFVTNSMLLNSETSLQKNYLGEAPNTQELGQDSPGYIGLFVGWQIVKKFMAQNDTMSLSKLLQTSPRIIFEQSKYKPK